MTPSKLIKRLRIDDPDHFRLAAFDPADTGGLDKDDAEAMLAALKELEQVRSAGGRRSRASERKEAVDVQGPMTSCTPRRRERILEPQKFNLRGGPMSPIASFSAVLIVATVVAQTAAVAQGLEVKRYNPSEWTKGRFSEVVTVNGPGKTIYLAGIGAEDENGPAGASAPILHPGSPYEQCRYAYDKIKRLLAAHGASLADAVKQVVYVTDVRFQADVAKCRREAYGDGPIPANTFLVISACDSGYVARDRCDRGGRQVNFDPGFCATEGADPSLRDVKVSVAVLNLPGKTVGFRNGSPGAAKA